MAEQPMPLDRGPKWLREAFNNLLDFTVRSRPLPGSADLAISEGEGGTQISVRPSAASSAGPGPFSLRMGGEDIIVEYGTVKARNQHVDYNNVPTDMTADGFLVEAPDEGDWVSIKVIVAYPNEAKTLSIDVTATDPPADVAPISGGADGQYYLPLGQLTEDGLTSVANTAFLFDVGCDTLGVWGRV